MGTGNVHKLEALGLIVGPVLALLFFLLEPGGILIDPVEPGDAVGGITALASNSALAHASSLLVPLSLLLMLFGLVGISRVTSGEQMSGGLSRLGILCMTIGGAGWILSAGLTHVLTETVMESDLALQQAIAVYRVDSGLTIISSMVVSAGVLAFSLGVSAMSPGGVGRTVALVVSAVSAIALITLIIGHTGPNPDMIRVARACYFPWAAWIAYLGVRFLKGSGLPQTAGN
ncbi:MAG: hypothetical protein F4Z41_05075 [Acidimicrobiia bacterium]|nr:hypothetical protein [Acidimicrobiia bacterium]